MPLPQYGDGVVPRLQLQFHQQAVHVELPNVLVAEREADVLPALYGIPEGVGHGGVDGYVPQPFVVEVEVLNGSRRPGLVVEQLEADAEVLDLIGVEIGQVYLNLAPLAGGAADGLDEHVGPIPPRSDHLEVYRIGFREVTFGQQQFHSAPRAGGADVAALPTSFTPVGLDLQVHVDTVVAG